MARLIDANALLLEIEEELSNESPFFTTEQNKLIDMGLRIAAGDIRHQPTVDAVEVVRCRDCKRCFKHTTKRNRQKMWICMRNEVDVCVRPDGFCSYGERKDGDGNG